MRSRWMRVAVAGPYLLAQLPAAGVTAVGMLALLVGVVSVVAGVGLVLVPILLLCLRLWTDLQRWGASRVLGVPVPSRFQPLPDTLSAWWRQFADRATARDLLWIPVQIFGGAVVGLVGTALVGIPAAAVVSLALWWVLPDGETISLIPDSPITSWLDALLSCVPIALGGAALLLFAAPPLASAWAWVTRAVLDRSDMEQLRERVGELTESRAGALDAHGAELRRIERDLHDGAQARLVSIALRLGIAQQALRDEPEVAAEMISQASAAADAAMGELRSVIRTMYPPILADRGLIGALQSLMANFPIPTVGELGDVGELPAAVEAAAYFVASEALLNVAKHSGATRATLSVRRTDDLLKLTVTDDGHGGADESRGTGLAGIRRRVGALDGRVDIASPLSGPTIVHVELPCVQ